MSSKKILISDDSILARKQLHDVIDKYVPDAKVYEAEDGKEAVTLFTKESPDLILIDITMPVMNGIEAIKEIIQINPSANIVVVSSIGTKTELKEAIKAGAVDFIQKTFSVSQIKVLLESYFKED
jgi:two-component system chemotaxis response regulator CheY